MKTSALFATFAAALLLSACGDDTTVNTCTTVGAVVDIVDNHQASGGDHKLVVSAADINAGTEKVYDIRGDNTGHTHSLTVSAADFTSLLGGTSVTIISSDTGAVGMDHTHEIRLSCAAAT